MRNMTSNGSFKALSTTDFDQYFHKNINYKGCYPNDLALPKSLTKVNDFMIINVDTSREPGSHWFCLKKVKQGLELFDS